MNFAITETYDEYVMRRAMETFGTLKLADLDQRIAAMDRNREKSVREIMDDTYLRLVRLKKYNK